MREAVAVMTTTGWGWLVVVVICREEEVVGVGGSSIKRERLLLISLWKQKVEIRRGEG